MGKKRLSGIESRNEIARFIQNHIQNVGISPTYKEIGDYVGISSSSAVRFHLNTMEKEGVIKQIRQPNGDAVPRGIVLLPAPGQQPYQPGIITPEENEGKYGFVSREVIMKGFL